MMGHSYEQQSYNVNNKTKVDRMFGDSLQSSPMSSVRGGSLSNLYQARMANDVATVEQIKQQFQKQIEAMLQSSQRHADHQRTSLAEMTHLTRAEIKSASQKDMPNFRQIPREKSFLEARTAVQKQIEKMFNESSTKEDGNELVPKSTVRHRMHGISHISPDDKDVYDAPQPAHYGITDAIRSRSQTSDDSPPRPSQIHERLSASSRAALDSSVRSISSSSGSSSSSSVGLSSGAANTKHLGNIDFSNSSTIVVNNPRLGGEREPSRRIHESKDNRQVQSPSVKSSETSRNFVSSSETKTSTETDDSSSLYDKVEVKEPRDRAQVDKSKHQRYNIEYLGAVPLNSKATDLRSLQVPMKELYFKHKAMQSLGHLNLPGTIEISDTGLKVQYIRELHTGVQEIFNSFPTIAVWAAVKFVHRTQILTTRERRQQFAFLPLISDPESHDKSNMFFDLDYDEHNLATDSPHPPVFACVMRRAGFPKQLECHGFICQSSEDAIIIAANLYQALLETMKRHKNGGHSEKSKEIRRAEILDRNTFDTRTPVRPPRRKKKPVPPEARVKTGLQRKKSLRSSIRSNRSNRSNRSTRNSHRRVEGGKNVRRSDSGRKSARRNLVSRSGSRVGKQPGDKVGDVFTKVAIGRTKSFVKPGSQYNLQELFRELKEKEGVESIDDVLRRVISPAGMSFNDIKPVYRELLLKLAMTMSKDEIFQRSKAIMDNTKRQKKKAKPVSQESTLTSILKRPFSKTGTKKGNMYVNNSLKSSKTLAQSQDSGVDTTSSKTAKSRSSSSGSKVLTKADISSPIPISKKPGDRRQLAAKEATTQLKDIQVDDAYVSCSECGYESVYNYDTCSCYSQNVQRKTTIELSKRQAGLKESPVSTFDCDTDSCISNDKCYCSLRGDPRCANGLTSDSKTSSSAIDSGTDSCYTYCQYSHNNTLRRGSQQPLGRPHGHLPHRPPGPKRTASGLVDHADNHRVAADRYKSYSCGSLHSVGTTSHDTDDYVYHHMKARQHRYPDVLPHHRQPQQPGAHLGYHLSRDRLAVYSPGGNTSRVQHRHTQSISSGHSSCSSGSVRSRHSSPSKLKRSQSKVLLVSAVDPSGNLVYRGASNHEEEAQASQKENIMSLKKSAEIAALFSGAKIKQTTNLVDHFVL